MKKTLTLLLTTLLSAAAANAELVASFSSLTSINQASGNWGFYTGISNYNPVFNGDGTATFQGGTDALYLQHYGENDQPSSVDLANYTLTMTISGLQPGGNAGNTSNTLFNTANAWGLCLSSNDNTKLTAQTNSQQWNSSNNQAFSFPTDAPFTLTVTMGSKNNTNGMYIYINGQEECFINGFYASTTSSNKYCIGNTTAGNKGTSFTLHNLYVHDTRLSATEVADFYASIPEPATASLSLMGLAALLMRRKRA